MTTPARFTRGTLGSNVALADAATHEFEDFRPPLDAGHTALMFRTNRVGTLDVFRVSDDNGLQRLRSIAVTDPTDEVLVRIDAAPLGQYRVQFTNTSGLAASVTLEGAWGP